MMIERLPFLVNEHVTAAFPSLQQDVMQFVIERNASFSIALGRVQNFPKVASRMPHYDTSCLPINRRPLESGEFALSHAGPQGSKNHLVQDAICAGDQLLDLIGRKVVCPG